jgi:mRNA-degrading endonuclease RelE of RelBE toxin-antitoxin system
VKFIETSVFTKKINSLLTIEEYRNFQNELILNPEKGKLIRGSGGVRIIYYWIKNKEIILMLLIYPKNEQDNLTSSQLKILKTIVEKELK